MKSSIMTLEPAAWKTVGEGNTPHETSCASAAGPSGSSTETKAKASAVMRRLGVVTACSFLAAFDVVLWFAGWAHRRGDVGIGFIHGR